MRSKPRGKNNKKENQERREKKEEKCLTSTTFDSCIYWDERTIVFKIVKNVGYISGTNFRAVIMKQKVALSVKYCH